MLFVIIVVLTISHSPSVKTYRPSYNIRFPSPQLQKHCQMANNGQPGICKPFDSCISAQYNWFHQNIHPTTCHFQQFNPIETHPQLTIMDENLMAIIPGLSATQSSTTPSTIRENIEKQRISDKICKDNYVLPKPSENNDFFITVVGGDLAQKGEFPFMAAIGWINILNETEFNCGGFLISANFILTAAHCTKLGGANPDMVRIGDDGLNATSFIDGVGDTSSSEDIKIESIFVHPNYNTKETYNDIAVIKLSSNSNVKPACLWQSNNIIGQYSNGQAIGYGHTQFAGARSNYLMKVTLDLIENLECSKSYQPEEKFPQGIINSQLCAGDPAGVKDTCQGDSGGPIVIKNVDKTPYAIGITSFGAGCASGIPSIYTRVSSYLDWVESIVWPDS